MSVRAPMTKGDVMKKSALLLWGLVALSLAPDVNAQALERVIYSCNNCISHGAIRNVDLNGALAMKKMGVGTYFLVVDGPHNTSMVYQATAVASLNRPSEPHRTLANGQHLVMKPVADRFDDLVVKMLQFYNAEPIGWQKEFVPEGS